MSIDSEMIIVNSKPDEVNLPIYYEKPPEHPNSRKFRLAGYSNKYFVCL
jgi:hypothetical protein